MPELSWQQMSRGGLFVTAGCSRRGAKVARHKMTWGPEGWNRANAGKRATASGMARLE
jgi:hypothetical protein